MASAAELRFAIRAVNEAKKVLQDTATDIEGVGHAAAKEQAPLSKFGGALGGVAKIAGGFVVAQGLMRLPSLIGDISSRARDLELQAKKAAVVFGEDLFGAAVAWADKWNEALGLSKNATVNLAAGLQDLLVPMGFTRDAAFDVSRRTIELAGALSEWTGGAKSAAEVSEILTKAYLGERDGLKALGVSISEADIAQALLAKNQHKLTGAALEQAKAMATMELIFAKSSDAQEAFAKGSDSAARKQGELKARVADLKDQLSVALQPAILAVSDALLRVMVPALTVAGEWIPTLVDMAGKAGTLLVDNVVAPLARFVGLAWSTVAPYIAAVADALAALVALAWDKLKDGVEQLGKLLSLGWAAIAPHVEHLADAVQRIALVAWDRIKEGLAALNQELAALDGDDSATTLDDLSAAFAKLYQEAKPAIDFLAPFVYDILDAMRDAVEQVASRLKALAKEFEDWAPLLDMLIPTLRVSLVGALIAVAVALEVFEAVLRAATALVEGLILALQGIVKAVEFTARSLKHGAVLIIGDIQTIVDKVQEFGGAVADVFGRVMGWMGDVGDEARRWADRVTDPIQWVIDRIYQLIDAIGRIPVFPTTLGKGLFDKIGDAVGFAHGGVVTTPTLSLIGERGEPEAVVPLSRAREFGFGGGATINLHFHGPVVGDMSELARALRRELAREIA